MAACHAVRPSAFRFANGRLSFATTSGFTVEASLFLLDYARPLTEGKDLEAEVVEGKEDCAEAGSEAGVNSNPELGFIS